MREDDDLEFIVTFEFSQEGSSGQITIGSVDSGFDDFFVAGSSYDVVITPSVE